MNIHHSSPEPEGCGSLLAQVAQECLDEADGDLTKATNLLQARVESDMDLYKQLLGHLVRQACYGEVDRLRRRHNQKCVGTPQPPPERERDRLRASATSLYNFKLLRGVSLGEATRSQILETANFYKKQADSMKGTADWLFSVASKLSATKKVKNQLSLEELWRLRKEATGG